MKFRISKDFAKSVKKLNGKELLSVIAMLDEVGNARTVADITDCKKLKSFDNVYRIRIGNRRAFFTLHIEIVGDWVFFRYLAARGQAYDKAMENALRKTDRETL